MHVSTVVATAAYPVRTALTTTYMDARRQRTMLAVGSVAGVICAAASLQLSKYWPVATASWFTAVGCAVAVTRWGTGWRHRVSKALLISALLALLSFVAFIGFYFAALRDL